MNSDSPVNIKQGAEFQPLVSNSNALDEITEFEDALSDIIVSSTVLTWE